MQIDKNLLAAAKSISPEAVKQTASTYLNTLKAAGLMDRYGNFTQRQALQPGSGQFLKNMANMAATGKMPEPPRPNPHLESLAAAGFGNGEMVSSGGIMGSGGGGFAGPFTNSLPQSGDPTNPFSGPRRLRGNVLEEMTQGASVINRTPWAPGVTPPPIQYRPSRQGGLANPGAGGPRPTGLPKPRR